MLNLSELFEGVQDVWLIWLAGVLGVVSMSHRAMRRPQWKNVLDFHQEDRGASYALPYMMVFPIYLIFMCWTIQGTMMLMTKFGVVHAAHMAARTAVVWRSADQYDQRRGWDTAQRNAQHAAALSLAPYACGFSRYQLLYPTYPGALARSARAIPGSIVYHYLYTQFAEETQAGRNLAKESYVKQKYVYAAAMTRVTLRESANRFNGELTAQVTHRMPLQVPLTGRLFGQLDLTRRAFYRDIRSTAVMPLETPESANLRLGIDYDPTVAN
jgi:hypothetical protein